MEIEKLEAQLRQLELKLNEIEAATEMTAPYLAYRKSIADLKTQHRRVENKVNDLKMSGGHDSVRIQSELDKAWVDLVKAFQQLKK